MPFAGVRIYKARLKDALDQPTSIAAHSCTLFCPSTPSRTAIADAPIDSSLRCSVALQADYKARMQRRHGGGRWLSMFQHVNQSRTLKPLCSSYAYRMGDQSG